MEKKNPFDIYFEEYDRWYDENKILFLNEVLCLKKLLPRFKKGIEIGVGSGRFAFELGIKYGVDPSKNLLKLARKRKIKVFGAYAEKLPFKDNEFDLVAFIFSICFLTDIKKAFKEAYRVCEKGGYVLIGMINSKSWLGRFYEVKKKENKFYLDANFYEPVKIIDILIKTGFHNIKTCQTFVEKKNIKKIKKLQKIVDGYDKGGFVVIRGEK